MAVVMLVSGVLLLIGGVAWISVPAAVALVGLLLVAASLDLAGDR